MKKNYLIIPFIVLAVDLLGSIFTSQGMEWYKTINVPAWTPKGSTIGMVWIVLFLMAAISALILWNTETKKTTRFKWAIGMFIANAIFNVLWSFLFFGNQMILAALIDGILLEISIIALIILAWPIARCSSIALIPYAIWVIFADYLTYSIWLIN